MVVVKEGEPDVIAATIPQNRNHDYVRVSTRCRQNDVQRAAERVGHSEQRRVAAPHALPRYSVHELLVALVAGTSADVARKGPLLGEGFIAVTVVAELGDYLFADLTGRYF